MIGFVQKKIKQGVKHMKRVMLTVAYDGTNYHGWQVQKTGLSIEEVLHNALCRLLGEDVEIIGASRTDAGVHALGNVAVFDTNTKIPAENICYALNQKLPDDIRILQSKEVSDQFHPRRVMSEKTYEYVIENRMIGSPVSRLYAYHVKIPLDVEVMKKAAVYIEGEHDFKCFCAAGSQAESTTRFIRMIRIYEEENYIRIKIIGNGFLYNMVRIIVGTLIEAGKARITPEEVEEIIYSKDRRRAGATVPPQGLTLLGIKYFE
jgi:tRNA pseudouridine38-40 synthase